MTGRVGRVVVVGVALIGNGALLLTSAARRRAATEEQLRAAVEAAEIASHLSPEDVIQVTGDVVERPREAVNPDMRTGEVEVQVEGDRLRRVMRRGTSSPRPLLYQGQDVFAWSDYPMDRFVFHRVEGHLVGLSEYHNGLFATYRHAARR